MGAGTASSADWMYRVRRHLAGDGAMLERSAIGGRVLLKRDDGTAIVVPAGVISAMADERTIRRSGSRVMLCGEHEGTDKYGDAGSVAAVPFVNDAESPISALRRLRQRDGSRFLSDSEFNAGERLRSDYTRGRIMPRLGANWTAAVSTGRRGGSGGAVDLSDAALAARQRVDTAIVSVGPELAGLLVDVCCFLKGMEQVEMERGWPARSAKVVLKAGLGALARHYDPDRRSCPDLLHWGSDDYRPVVG